MEALRSTHSVPAASSTLVYFVSLGCPKNLVDSQVMLGLLGAGGYVLTQSPAEAQVIIVNTCSFIGPAKEESINALLEMAELKAEGRCRVLVASGCLAQRYATELAKELPEVDLFLGTGQYHRITELLSRRSQALAQGAPLPPRAYVDQPAFIHSELDPRMHTGPLHSAYLKISEGCNRRCSFCIIPKLRGNVRSRSVDSLVAEARSLAANGVRELNLVAQDLTEYGMEGKYRERLEILLPELAQISQLEWIRLHYVYPDQFSDELIEIIAREPKIVKYLDMPIQHTNSRILKQMNRRLTKEKLFALVQKLRERIPDLVFRTSIIVGFPGETAAEFAELCEDLVALKLDYVGVFRYSSEEGTPAALLEGGVPFAVRRKRASILKAILAQQAQRRQRRYLGQRVRVLIEGPSDETDLLLQGRMSTQAQEIDGQVLINEVLPPLELSRLKAGDFVEVEITAVTPGRLVGTACQGSSMRGRLAS